MLVLHMDRMNPLPLQSKSAVHNVAYIKNPYFCLEILATNSNVGMPMTNFKD